jgi:hypothetical protein
LAQVVILISSTPQLLEGAVDKLLLAERIRVMEVVMAVLLAQLLAKVGAERVVTPVTAEWEVMVLVLVLPVQVVTVVAVAVAVAQVRTGKAAVEADLVF